MEPGVSLRSVPSHRLTADERRTAPACKRCGQPVVVSRANYEAMESMHWLCFHLEYEHAEYDVDAPCEQDICPVSD